ncbi:MAG: O-antigen ligase family protein [Gordonibacter pamelaeae]
MRIIVILLCMVAGVVTGARTFYYLLVIVGAYLMLAKTRDVSLEKKALLLCLMIAVVAVVASPLGQSMIDSLTFQDTVSSRDIKRQLAIAQSLAEFPVFGIGTGQYAIYEASLGMPANSGLHGTNPHNVYVQVLCENGLVGFIPFVLGLICSLWLAFKRKNALAVVLLVIYTAIGWSLGILYSIAFTSFFVVFVCSLLGTSED